MYIDYVAELNGLWQDNTRTRIRMQWQEKGKPCYIAYDGEFFALTNFDFLGTHQVYYAGWGMSETNPDSWMFVSGLVINTDWMGGTRTFDAESLKINGRSLKGTFTKMSD